MQMSWIFSSSSVGRQSEIIKESLNFVNWKEESFPEEFNSTGCVNHSSGPEKSFRLTFVITEIIIYGIQAMSLQYKEIL